MKKILIESITWCFQTPRRMVVLLIAITVLLSMSTFNLFAKGTLVGIIVTAVVLAFIILFLFLRNRIVNPWQRVNIGHRFIDIIDGTPPAGRVEANRYQARRVFGWFVISSLLGNVAYAYWWNNGFTWEQVFEHRGSQLVQLATIVAAALFGLWFIFLFGKHIFTEIFKKEKPKPVSPPPRRARTYRRT